MKRILFFTAIIIALFFVACSKNQNAELKDEASAPLQNSEITNAGEPSQKNPSQTIPIPDKLPVSADSIVQISKSQQQVAFDWDKSEDIAPPEPPQTPQVEEKTEEPLADLDTWLNMPQPEEEKPSQDEPRKHTKATVPWRNSIDKI